MSLSSTVAGSSAPKARSVRRGLRDEEGPSTFSALREPDEAAGAEAPPEAPPLQELAHDDASHPLSPKAHSIPSLSDDLAAAWRCSSGGGSTAPAPG